MKHPIGLKERGQYTWRQMKKYKVSYGFIAPFMIIFVLFTVAPVIIAMFFSLTNFNVLQPCLLYTSPSPRDRTRSRMPSSA